MINPAIGSRWTTRKGGKDFYITIDGMWATGYGDRFQVLSYDIKYDHLKEIQNIPAERMELLIKKKTIIHLAVDNL